MRKIPSKVPASAIDAARWTPWARRRHVHHHRRRQGSPVDKAIIHEMFGDGIMSAIDFELDVQKKEDPKGDRVIVTMNGKFLPYKKW